MKRIDIGRVASTLIRRSYSRKLCSGAPDPKELLGSDVFAPHYAISLEGAFHAADADTTLHEQCDCEGDDPGGGAQSHGSKYATGEIAGQFCGALLRISKSDDFEILLSTSPFVVYRQDL